MAPLAANQIEAVDEVLATTRSIRRGLDLERPVARELVEECVELALQGPSGSNILNAHFVVVTDPDIRAELGDVYRRGWAVYEQTPVYAGALRWEEPAHQARQEEVLPDALWLVEHIQEVPVLVVPCVDFGVGRGRVFADAGVSREVVLPTFVQAGLWGGIMPVATRFRLAARARGLGSTWTVVHLAFEEDAAEILGIPYEGVLQAGLFPLAYASEDAFRRAWRPPLAESLHWDAW